MDEITKLIDRAIEEVSQMYFGILTNNLNLRYVGYTIQSVLGNVEIKMRDCCNTNRVDRADKE